MQIDPAADRAMLDAVRPQGRSARERRPWLPLLNAVLTLAGDKAQLLSHAETPWASITFSGSRHMIALEFLGDDGADAADALIAALPEHEFAIPHKLVADATIARVEQVMVPERRVRIEAELLLLDES